MSGNVYTRHGYRDRKDYLKCLAEDFDLPYKVVAACASMLGEGEDFDGLLGSLEDYCDMEA